jgi:hypothetical protein
MTDQAASDPPVSGADCRQDFTKHLFWDDLAALDPAVVREKSGATVRETGKGPVYVLDFMAMPYELDLPARAIRAPLDAVTAQKTPATQDPQDPAYYTKAVLLSYLVKASSGPAPGLSGRELGPQSLPWGDLFFKGPHELPKAPLAKAFGDSPDALERASQAIGARSHGRLAWVARVLPFAEIYYYLEPADDEFPAETRFNFDANICYYLTLDVIFGLTNCLTDRLIALKDA